MAIKETIKETGKEVLRVERRNGRPKANSASSEPTTTVGTVTPELAAKWLARNNPSNRKISPTMVSSYARDMKRGKWRFSNDAICFDPSGNLLNGQHRLSACVLAGVSFRSLIIRNLPADAQEIMDQGKPRRLAEILGLRGNSNNNRLAGALRALIHVAHAGESYRAYRPSTTELIELLERHPRIVDSVALVEHPKGVAPSLLGAIHYIGANILKEREKADAFVKVFTTGVPAYPQDPAHTLRESTLRHRDRRTRREPHLQFYATLRAWNAFRKGETRAKWASPRDVEVIEGLDPKKI